MGSTQYYVAQSLDGYIAERDGGLDWLLKYDGEAGADASQATDGEYDRFFAEVGAVVMGSATYEFILAEEQGRWPYEGAPCWVLTSRELPVPDGADVRFASGPVAPVHDQLRGSAEPGRSVRASANGRRLPFRPWACDPGCVNDDRIRALLSSVQPSGWIDRTPDTVALMRSRVEAAGGDPDAVAQWVRAHGGRLERTPPYRSRGMGARYRQHENSGDEFYVVPTKALAR